MANPRTDREIETRENEETPTYYRPPSSLPEPRKKEGWAYRWVRLQMLNQYDDKNFAAKTQDGWEPCSVEEHPEMAYLMPNSGNRRDKDRDNSRDDRLEGMINVGGLVLCKCPAERVNARNAHYEKRALRQLQNVDAQLDREQDRKTNMTIDKQRFGDGSVPG